MNDVVVSMLGGIGLFTLVVGYLYSGEYGELPRRNHDI